MKTLRRLIYLAYYYKQLDRVQLDHFMKFTREQLGVSKIRQWFLIISSSLKYNISLLEFYQFGFMDKTPEERKRWAGTGTMYEFQLVVNPPESRGLLSDKRRFYKAYRQFFRHQMYSRTELSANDGLCESLIEDHDHLVLKKADGNCGAQVAFVKTTDYDASELISLMINKQYDLVETFAHQHEALDRLSPSGINTVRIFTRLGANDQSIILGCRLRISVDSPVDNLAAGNLAAPVDEETGVVTGPGIYADITRLPETVHPITGVSIVGLQLPFWRETLDLVHEAGKLHPENRSIGWDIVITPEGPGLIEGNHDWCKLVWQLPVGKGLKHLLYDEAIEYP